MRSNTPSYRTLFTRLAVSSLLLLSSLVSGCGDSSSPPNTPSAKLQQAMDTAWGTYKSQYNLPGGGIAIYLSTPSGNYFAASGMGPNIGPDTRFRAASNTKTFTSAAIMLLQQQGKLRLDDTIDSPIPGRSEPYVPSSAQYNIPYKNQITIRQLLNHTAGVYDITNDNVPASCSAVYADKSYLNYIMQELGQTTHQFTPDELVGVAANCQASYFAPGTGFHYSNTGYSLLAIIIKQVSGVSYDQFVRDNLLVPNGLLSTSIPMLGTDQGLPSPFASGYIFYDGVLSDVTVSNMSANIAEGNIISTPSDLAQWIRRLIRGEAGPDTASVAEMKTPSVQSTYPYGLGILSEPGLGYGHNGAHAGYLSYMLYDPTADVAVVIYSNVWDYANLMTNEVNLLKQAMKDGRAAVGY